jgi:hypothetical protein
VGGVSGLPATTVPTYYYYYLVHVVQHWLPCICNASSLSLAALIARPDASIGMHVFGHPSILPFLMKSPFAHLSLLRLSPFSFPFSTFFLFFTFFHLCHPFPRLDFPSSGIILVAARTSAW